VMELFRRMSRRLSGVRKSGRSGTINKASSTVAAAMTASRRRQSGSAGDRSSVFGAMKGLAAMGAPHTVDMCRRLVVSGLLELLPSVELGRGCGGSCLGDFGSGKPR
jgi:hypothetical protein